MAYNPLTDFLALIRKASGQASFAEIPGLDFVMAALARTGQFALSTGQTAPIVNQPTTVWLRPANPSWTAEGTVFLWNSTTEAYETATPALWAAFFDLALRDTYQAVTGAAGTIDAGTDILVVRRTAPASTALVLPAIAERGKPLRIVDWSSAVVQHIMTLSTPDGALIMRRADWSIYSTTDQLGVATLSPVLEINGWVAQ